MELYFFWPYCQVSARSQNVKENEFFGLNKPKNGRITHISSRTYPQAIIHYPVFWKMLSKFKH